MERHFHEDLRTLTLRLAAMGDLVEARARDAVSALIERRADLAAIVATGDRDVNELEIEIDDLSLKLLALQHPVASDLRRVRSIIKANTDLERVGDQAVNIAQTAIGLVALPPLTPTLEVGRLGDVAIGMLHDSMAAFVDHDVSLARSVLVRDDEADGLRDTIFRVLLTHMMADPGTIERGLGLILVSRALERIADHATNIAEDLIFLVEGRIVRLENPETVDYGRREPGGS
jgi:phosphate transport system protein